MRHQLATLVLGPILYLQGRSARRRLPRLPEASGPRSGREGSGPRLRLLVTGDSAAAGVGVPSQGRALAGQVVSMLREDYRLEWRLEARTGATTLGTLSHLERLEGGPFDVVVTSLGVNDLTRGVDMDEWLDSQRRLRRTLRDRFGAQLLVVAGLPPVGGFPALPQPLRWYLGARAEDFTRDLRRELEGEPDTEFVDLHFTLDPTLMASDGFHPGPEIYRGWAERVALRVRDRDLDLPTP